METIFKEDFVNSKKICSIVTVREFRSRKKYCKIIDFRV